MAVYKQIVGADHFHEERVGMKVVGCFSIAIVVVLVLIMMI